MVTSYHLAIKLYISNIQHPVQSGFYPMVNPILLPTYTDHVQKPSIVNILENCLFAVTEGIEPPSTA